MGFDMLTDLIKFFLPSLICNKQRIKSAIAPYEMSVRILNWLALDQLPKK